MTPTSTQTPLPAGCTSPSSGSAGGSPNAHPAWYDHDWLVDATEAADRLT